MKQESWGVFHYNRATDEKFPYKTEKGFSKEAAEYEATQCNVGRPTDAIWLYKAFELEPDND